MPKKNFIVVLLLLLLLLLVLRLLLLRCVFLRNERIASHPMLRLGVL